MARNWVVALRKMLMPKKVLVYLNLSWVRESGLIMQSKQRPWFFLGLLTYSLFFIFIFLKLLLLLLFFLFLFAWVSKS